MDEGNDLEKGNELPEDESGGRFTDEQQRLMRRSQTDLRKEGITKIKGGGSAELSLREVRDWAYERENKGGGGEGPAWWGLDEDEWEILASSAHVQVGNEMIAVRRDVFEPAWEEYRNAYLACTKEDRESLIPEHGIVGALLTRMGRGDLIPDSLGKVALVFKEKT